MHVCRQLRAKYLPLCLRSPVWIDWKDVPGYLDTFFPTIESKIQNIDKAPASITIFAAPDDRYHPGVYVDILPVWKQHHARPMFECRFAYSDAALAAAEETQVINQERQICLEADNEMFGKFINHANERWISDVESGLVLEVSLSFPGSSITTPAARIYLNRDSRSSL
jgi:hypothetical protein